MTDLLAYEDQIRQQAKDEARAELIATLLERGLSATTISNYTGTPLTQVNNVLKVYLKTVPKTPEDEELAKAARSVLRRSLAYADLVMQTGTVDARLKVLGMFAPAARAMIGNEAGGAAEESMAALEALFASQKVTTSMPKPLDMGDGWEVIDE